jgi:putative peptide zinc metalloprotease protein
MVAWQRGNARRAVVFERAQTPLARRGAAGSVLIGSPGAGVAVVTPGELLAPGKPKFRSDIIMTRQGDAANAAVVAKDPRTTRFFRIRAAEHFIAGQLDGQTSLDVIRQRTEQHFGAALSPETLTQFVRTLQDHDLLETHHVRRGSRSHSRLKGSLLYLRFKVLDPDRFLAGMVRPLGPLFSATFVVLSLALIAIAAATFASNTHEVGRDLVRLFSVQSLVVAWILVVLVGAVHEFAHGLACKRFGGEVHDIGIFLIYFNPAFYCDVSDAWLFPQKWKRLVVTLVGPYLEMVLWAFGVITWRLTDPDNLVNSMALIVVAATGLKIFLNLNPLLKLDGYYLLSDSLDVPNLRQRSFDYLRNWRTRRGQSPEAAPVSHRERIIYLLYGSLASLYSFGTLWFVAGRLGGTLIPRFHEWGLLLFLVLFGVRLRNRLRPLLFGRSSAFRPERKPDEATPRARRGRVAVAVLAVAVVGSLVVKVELRVGGEFRVLPTRNADVRAEVEGLVAEVYVREGMRLKRGDLVARLWDRDLVAELRKTEAQITEKQAQLRMLRIGPRPEEVAVAENEVATAEARAVGSARRYEEAKRMRGEKLVRQETTVTKAEERLKYKRSNRDRMRALLASAMVSLKDFEQAEEDAVVKEKELDEARSELQITLADDLAELRKEMALAETGLAEARGKQARLLAGFRGEEIEAKEAEIARLATQKRHLEQQVLLTEIPSTITGLVTTPERQLRELIGQHVNKGDLLASVHQLDTITAEIALSEKDVGDVATGQPVAVKVRSYPSLTFEGTVTSVAAMVRTGGVTPGVKPAAAPVPEEGGGDRVILVTTEIENQSMLLKPEMTGRAKISCGEQPLLTVLTRRLARIVRVEFWSWW